MPRARPYDQHHADAEKIPGTGSFFKPCSRNRRTVVRDDSVLRVLPGERFTPCGLAGKFHARVLLESSSLANGRERYSLLLLDEAFSIVQQGPTVSMIKDGTITPIAAPARDILDVISGIAAQNPVQKGGLPTPTGGYGFLGYEFAARCDSIVFSDKPDPSGLYDAHFIFGHLHIIFDHATDLVYILGVNYEQSHIDLERAVDEVVSRMNDLDFNYLAQSGTAAKALMVSSPGEDRQFMEQVDLIRDQIIKGNLLQAVLSRKLRISSGLSAFDAYKRLRTINPSPYMFYLDFSSYQLFGASPEVMVKVKGRKAVVRPIAGTRRRGGSVQEDLELEKELLGDEKERAEHIMLIDLARNDLGRLCEPGSVTLSERMGIERYSHVMHIVSEVEGTLVQGKHAADAVRAVFPAGTVSGAPKIQAMKIIDSLEREKRSWYAGLVGYMEANGNMDTCITIRTALKQGEDFILQAGAGIVHDSDPKRELEETNEKLRAMASSLGLEV
jgi:anthranilate synthase component I